MTLWAITAYFNPAGYARRRRNYRLFRAHLTVPLVTVELSLTGRFELEGEDADILVRVEGGDVMWQKERLLNLAVARVPDGCTRIAWLDCDVVFGDDGWAERAHAALDQHALVHLFRTRHNLSADADITQLDSVETPPSSDSLIYRVSRNEAAPEDFFQPDAPIVRRTTVGLAWASHRTILAKHGLYDAAILGSGDRAIACAAFGRLDFAARALAMNAAQVRHYESWALPYFSALQSRVGFIDGRLFHLWHGELANRQYAVRHHQLETFGFDPFEDIAVSPGGAWRWDTAKPAMHAFMRRYFESRREDGDGVT